MLSHDLTQFLLSLVMLAAQQSICSMQHNVDACNISTGTELMLWSDAGLERCRREADPYQCAAGPGDCGGNPADH